MSKFRRLGRAALRVFPAPLGNVLRRLYHGVLLPSTYAWQAARDERLKANWDLPAVPPPRLRHRVHGGTDLTSFLEAGRANFAALTAALDEAAVVPEDVRTVLDFGCGCGRTALWWTRRFADHRYVGLDIDTEAIGWDRDNLPGVFEAIGPHPPTRFETGSFDVILAISVFTHLDRDLQDAWLAELRRLARPGGLVLASVHSEQVARRLPRAAGRALARDGIVFVRYNVLPKVFPAFYQTTYHARGYVESHWSRFFQILGYVGLGDQDLVVMRRQSPIPVLRPPRKAYIACRNAGPGEEVATWPRSSEKSSR